VKLELGAALVPEAEHVEAIVVGTALAPKASWRSELGAYWNPRQSRWWPALCVVLVPEAEQAKDGFGCCIGTSGRASECWYWVLYWYLRQSRLRLVLVRYWYLRQSR
jgi:hypothetical protein